MAFQSSGNVVALHFGNNTAKAYLCHQGSTASLSISRLACCTLNLAEKHGITLIPAYIPTHLNMELDYLWWGRLVPEWCLLPHISEVVFQLWGQLEVDLQESSHANQCKQYYTLEIYYLWKPSDWILFIILGHFMWVMCFLHLH